MKTFKRLKEEFELVSESEPMPPFDEVLARDTGNSLGVDWEKVDFNEFMKGMNVELEHADITRGAPILTAKIALAHLKELPDYYTRLEKMEKKK
jgi:hypothetical protein